MIEKHILELLDIDEKTDLEMSTDGERLIIEPVRRGRRKRIGEVARKVMGKNEGTMRKLAK